MLLLQIISKISRKYYVFCISSGKALDFFFERGGIFFRSAGSSLWNANFEYFGNDNSNEAKADTCEWK